MTNDLKNFLEGERQTFIKNKDTMTPSEYMEWNSKYDTRLINFVLDLVEKEAEKKGFPIQTPKDNFYIGFKELSTIINNLRVK